MLLDMAAQAAPARVAVGDRASGLTFGGLLLRARRFAALLRQHGSAHAVLLGLNSEAVPVLLFGSALAGVPFVPLNYRLDDDRLRSVADRVADGLYVVDDDMLDRVAGLGLRVVPRSELEAALMAERDEPAEQAPYAPDDVAVLLFTSGTTGEPKAAVLRHRHLTSYILGTVEFLAAGDEEAQLVSVPPYHIAGISAVLSSVFAGRRIVYLPAFDPVAWVGTVAEQEVTQAMVVPTMLGRILDELDRSGTQLPRLGHLSYGGGRMPPSSIERAMAALPGVRWVNAYGLTETSSTIAVLGPEDHEEAFRSDDPAVRERLRSVGRPLPTVELEIRDEEGRVVAAGQKGEIFVRGEQIAGEYLGRSVLTDHGWFPTNDAGYLDEAGYLYLDGRLDDVIVRGGENLSPGEIEDTMLAHPAVAEAAVVGLPDDEWGERVVAAAVLRSGVEASAEDLQTWVRERLRSTKTPEWIEFRAELPHNETGKLLRRVLKVELAETARLRRPNLTGAER